LLPKFLLTRILEAAGARKEFIDDESWYPIEVLSKTAREAYSGN